MVDCQKGLCCLVDRGGPHAPSGRKHHAAARSCLVSRRVFHAPSVMFARTLADSTTLAATTQQLAHRVPGGDSAATAPLAHLGAAERSGAHRPRCQEVPWEGTGAVAQCHAHGHRACPRAMLLGITVVERLADGDRSSRLHVSWGSMSQGCIKRHLLPAPRIVQGLQGVRLRRGCRLHRACAGAGAVVFMYEVNPVLRVLAEAFRAILAHWPHADALPRLYGAFGQWNRPLPRGPAAGRCGPTGLSQGVVGYQRLEGLRSHRGGWEALHPQTKPGTTKSPPAARDGGPSIGGRQNART
mmetsp:Transcript_89635/g.254092  ORF Transcript_89635/g.254092 Transcript_89635/m.254092 type:complete len:298 (-) Transcript_89635:2-895(-)